MNAARTPHDAGLAEAGLDQALLERACFGQGVPEQAEIHLRLAGLAYQQDNVAEGHLRQALEIAPDHAAVLIGLYRFYFYKGRLNDALAVAERCVVKAATDNGLAPDWRKVEREDADFGNYASILPRFYLFTLKAYGYLLMRLGRLEEGRAAILKLLELDASDKVGGKILLQVLDRMGRDDDYGE